MSQADVTSYARTVDPHHLGTYTNDRAEVIPFPVSTRASSEIDFISQAHYNFSSDFYRDWTPSAKLTQETLWQHDLYGMPTFVRESGWRTEPLSQTPPLTDYAWSLNDEHKAELYLRQATLMAVYPWIPGWAYFKWYDKRIEGDFGFLDDAGSQRPIADLAECINPYIQVNTTSQRPPQRWVYYPEYALAAPYAAYEHYKTLVEILEHDFFQAYEERVTETLDQVLWPLTVNNCAAITNTRLFTDLVNVFNERWQPFAFTSTVPTDELPILLAGRALELLSSGDRDALAQKRTVTFGPVGISDERFHSTTPWYAEIVSATVSSPDRVTANSICPAAEPTVNILSYPITAYAGRSVEVGVEWCNLPDDAYQHYDLIVQLENKVITPHVYYVHNFTDFDLTGMLTVTLDIDLDHALAYTQPITGSRYVAAFISKADNWTDVLTRTPETIADDITIQPRRWVTVTTSCGLVCPAWTGWTAQPISGTYRTLATFQGGELDGQPAIIQSPDGRHSAFLYDALSWKPIESNLEKEKIEESLACHNLLLQPATPTLFSPPDGTLTSTETITFTWSDVCVAGYNFNLDGVITDVGVATQTSRDISSDGTYTWTVAAYGPVGNASPYTDVWSFTVDAIPPDAPVLSAPTDNTITSTAELTLTWQASSSPDVIGYWLDFNGTGIDVGNTTFYTTGVLADGVYTWTVAAYSPLHTSTYANAWSFTVDTTPPDVPVLSAPANNTITNTAELTLTWQASPNPDVAGYLLDFNGEVVDVGNTTFSTTSILADGVYTWTVAAYDVLSNTSPDTDAWSFIVDATPPVTPVLSAPANNDTITNTAKLTLTWQANPDSDLAGYLLDFNGTDTDVGNTTFSTTGVLADGFYTWTVAAYDALSNTSDYADVWSFTVAIPPKIIAKVPDDKAGCVSLSAPIIITFSEAISTSTFIYTVSPNPGGWLEIWDNDETVVTLTHTDFISQTTYTITVTAADDLAGNLLSDTPYAWRFLTWPHYCVYQPLVLKNP